MKKILFLTLFLFVPFTMEAKTITLSQIQDMPTSIEKDYYIWRFLRQSSTSAYEADIAIKEAERINDKIRQAYGAKTGKRARVTPKQPKFSRAPTQSQKKAWLMSKNGVSFTSLRNKAVQALENNNEIAAVAYYQKAAAAAHEKLQEDEALFWLYYITRKNSYLRKLLDSWDVNLYTLVARDLEHVRYPRTFTPKLPKRDLSHYDPDNPIDWAKIKQKIFNSNISLKSLSDEYEAEECQGVYCYIRTQASEKREIYFPMPYREIMQHLPTTRQAIIYAIARQESRFVPASVSTSFALGMMQIMPFLIDHIAKERNEHIDYDQMFNPKVALIYANHHLNYLSRYLHNPLFIAYSYNGGIGFTKRLISNPKYFKKGKYEPMLSMEKISNVEAREYGKKVLVNYVIYLNKLGTSARISSYINDLTEPSETDEFR